MIITELKWKNFLSYGDKDNFLKIDEFPVTQISGSNGAGKTTIALALSEALTGANFKKLMKSELFNIFDPKPIEIACKFTSNNSEYEIQYYRTPSKLTVTLYKNSEDISGHTTKGTYELLQEEVNLDANSINSMIYQSPKIGLDFLTATDAKRKNFLAELLNLEEYALIYKAVRGASTEIKNEIKLVESKISSVEDFMKITPVKVEIENITKEECEKLEQTNK